MGSLLEGEMERAAFFFFWKGGGGRYGCCCCLLLWLMVDCGRASTPRDQAVCMYRTSTRTADWYCSTEMNGTAQQGRCSDRASDRHAPNPKSMQGPPRSIVRVGRGGGEDREEREEVRLRGEVRKKGKGTSSKMLSGASESADAGDGAGPR